MSGWIDDVLWNTGRIFSALPSASDVPGAIAYITDCTSAALGTVAAGSGGFKVIVWSDGSNWLVIGASENNSTVVGNAAIATTATNGFLYIPTCAGPPTGTPTTVTGFVPLVFDTTNSQFWIYAGGGWKQPKTLVGAGIVNWE